MTSETTTSQPATTALSTSQPAITELSTSQPATSDSAAPESMSIRRLRWWQIQDLLPIEADLFGREQWTAPMFWNELANGHHYLVATEPDGTVLGYAGIAIGRGEAWINNIAVRRDAQRRGIGRALLEALLDEARPHQVEQVLLEVAADNAPAQKLYASYGFDVIGVRKGYYQPSNTDALVMQVDLPHTTAVGDAVGDAVGEDGERNDG